MISRVTHYLEGFPLVSGRVCIYAPVGETTCHLPGASGDRGGSAPLLDFGFTSPTTHYLKGLPLVPGGRAKDPS